MYNTTRGFGDKDIDIIDKTNIMVNVEMESVHPPSRRELYYNNFQKYLFMEDDEILRRSFGISTELEH